MQPIRGGFFKDQETLEKVFFLVRNVSNSPIVTPADIDEVIAFARWCIERGAARVNDSVVANMKGALLACLAETASKRRLAAADKELRRRALCCLGKASDEVFDDANRLSNTLDPGELCEVLSEAYAAKFRMVLW